jgi:menaquinone-dependent protoporphyrinogen oxidase
MSARVLVAYGSKHGSTAEIAERIGATLRESGLEVDVRRASDVGGMEGYDAIVLGSAVYALRWRRDAHKLLRRLFRGGGDVWLFSSGWIGKPPADLSKLVSPGIRRAAARIGARDHAIFGGRYPLEPSNFIERAMVEKAPEGERDSRDWDAIETWARGIASTLHRDISSAA